MRFWNTQTKANSVKILKRIINIIFSILFLIVGMLLGWGTKNDNEEKENGEHR